MAEKKCIHNNPPGGCWNWDCPHYEPVEPREAPRTLEVNDGDE